MSSRQVMTMNQTLKRPITLVSVLVVAALTIGVAVAQRAEMRASADVFSVGTERLPVSVD